MFFFSFILKVLAFVGVSSISWFGIYFSNNYFQNSISKFDRALINHLLSGKGNDIVFKIKKNTTDLTDFSNALDSENTKITIEASTKDNVKGNKDGLKQLNNNNDWTWKCEFEFQKESDSTTVNAVNEKESKKILKNDLDQGLWDQLKKDISTSENYSTRFKKINFIKKCAKERTTEKNKSLNKMDNLTSESNEVKNPSPITIKMVKGSSSDKPVARDETKLFFKIQDTLNYWFPEL